MTCFHLDNFTAKNRRHHGSEGEFRFPLKANSWDDSTTVMEPMTHCEEPFRSDVSPNVARLK